ncbi:MAG TPA: response regulator [Gemmataceae bacterium]|jgi:DNA-binding response OmpR family regulator|nr:response regulator [Gemmataceae bacterium]
MTSAKVAVLLIVEDDEKLCVSMQRFLVQRGYRVWVATTEAAALASLSQVHPEAAVVDLHLPDGSGFHVLEVMRDQGFNIPVILMTADDSYAARQRAQQLGVFAFLTKPVQPFELLRQLERAVASRTMNAD